MALQLARPTRYGAAVTSNYWRITSIYIDVANRVARIELTGYANALARAANAHPLATMTFDWIGGEFPFDLVGIGGNVLNQSYTKLKSLAEWSTAVDV